MTTQEAYELMRVYLTRPGARRAHEGVCRYETQIEAQTHRCAIGCLLTPETLGSAVMIPGTVGDEEMWGEIVPLRDFMGNIAAVQEAGYPIPELDDVDGGFLIDAQFEHDNINNWEAGRFNPEGLDRVAENHDLTVVKDEPVNEGAPRELVTA